MFAKIFTTLLAVAATASAASIHVTRAQLDVINPHIETPAAGDVWTVGTVQTITWDTTEIPSTDSGKTGTILLGFHNTEDPTNEHLDTDRPLANSFLLTDGQVNVTVPNKPEMSSYFVVLLGDSGNASDEFSIVPATSA